MSNVIALVLKDGEAFPCVVRERYDYAGKSHTAQTSDRKRAVTLVNFSCFKTPHVWKFLTATIKNK